MASGATALNIRKNSVGLNPELGNFPAFSSLSVEDLPWNVSPERSPTACFDFQGAAA